MTKVQELKIPAQLWNNSASIENGCLPIACKGRGQGENGGLDPASPDFLPFQKFPPSPWEATAHDKTFRCHSRHRSSVYSCLPRALLPLQLRDIFHSAVSQEMHPEVSILRKYFTGPQLQQWCMRYMHILLAPCSFLSLMVLLLFYNYQFWVIVRLLSIPPICFMLAEMDPFCPHF